MDGASARINGLLVRIGGNHWIGAGLPKIAKTQLGWLQSLRVAVIEKSVHSSIVPRRVMGFTRRADERQKWRPWGSGNPGIRTSRSPSMIPGNESQTGVLYKAVLLTSRASRAVVHGVTTLPFLFNR